MEAITDVANEKAVIESETGFHCGAETGRCDSCNDPGACEVLEVGSELDEPSTSSGNALLCRFCAVDAWAEWQKWAETSPEWIPA